MKVPEKAWILSSALQLWAILQTKREDPGTLELGCWSKIVALLQSSQCTDHAEAGTSCKSLMNVWDKCSFQPLSRLTLVI